MRIRRIAVYEKESRYHDSLVFCKMQKNNGEKASDCCDYPSTSREGYCDFHQWSKSNANMKPEKCSIRGCDRSFCGKVLRVTTKNGKQYDHIYCQLHFKRAKNGEDLFRAFGRRYSNKNVYDVSPYVKESQL